MLYGSLALLGDYSKIGKVGLPTTFQRSKHLNSLPRSNPVQEISVVKLYSTIFSSASKLPVKFTLPGTT